MGCSSEEEKCSQMHRLELPGGFCTQKLFLLGVCKLPLCIPSTVQPPRALVGAIPSYSEHQWARSPSFRC